MMSKFGRLSAKTYLAAAAAEAKAAGIYVTSH
jgi:hypothetical protein